MAFVARIYQPKPLIPQITYNQSNFPPSPRERTHFGPYIDTIHEDVDGHADRRRHNLEVLLEGITNYYQVLSAAIFWATEKFLKSITTLRTSSQLS